MGGRGATSATGVVVQRSAGNTPPSHLTNAIYQYTHGAYEGMTDAASIDMGAFGPFDSRITREFFERKGANAFYTPEELRQARAIVSEIEAQKLTSVPVIRTEWRSDAPSVGNEITWGLKSASLDKNFAHKVASGQIEGMNGFLLKGQLPSEQGHLVAYHIEGQHRHLDISTISDYAEQREVLLHGRYKVTKTSEEFFDTGILTNRAITMTPREYAASEGLSIEHFTSKKGIEMARFGTHTYPLDKMDIPSMAFKSGTKTDRVKIVHVYLSSV